MVSSTTFDPIPLRDLAELDGALIITCPCGRRSRVPSREIIAGRETWSIGRVKEALRCTKCGSNPSFVRASLPNMAGVSAKITDSEQVIANSRGLVGAEAVEQVLESEVEELEVGEVEVASADFPSETDDWDADHWEANFSLSPEFD